METTPRTRPSAWPLRLVVALALVTFPLIWVGGLVTTYDAGMAVPDWPGTYGYNLFLYPWQTWLAGPWDLFIEHGHRLLGATAGILAIALVAASWRDPRKWLLPAAGGALALVIVQGVLGGARVLLDARLVALLHACTGPLFFAYLAGLVAAVSQREALGALAVEPSVRGAGLRLMRAAWWTAGLAYLQLVLGAVVRHVPLTAPAGIFRTFLLLHLLLAGGLLVQAGLTAWRAASVRAARGALGGLRRGGLALVLLLAVQIGLGVGTYVCKYSWPGWLTDYGFAAGHVVEERSLTQALVTTAHVANGSLILFVAVLLAARATRFFRAGAGSPWKMRAVSSRTYDLAAACRTSRAAVSLEPSPLQSEP